MALWKFKFVIVVFLLNRKLNCAFNENAYHIQRTNNFEFNATSDKTMSLPHSEDPCINSKEVCGTDNRVSCIYDIQKKAAICECNDFEILMFDKEQKQCISVCDWHDDYCGENSGATCRYEEEESRVFCDCSHKSQVYNEETKKCRGVSTKFTTILSTKSTATTQDLKEITNRPISSTEDKVFSITTPNISTTTIASTTPRTQNAEPSKDRLLIWAIGTGIFLTAVLVSFVISVIVSNVIIRKYKKSFYIDDRCKSHNKRWSAS